LVVRATRLARLVKGAVTAKMAAVDLATTGERLRNLPSTPERVKASL